MSTLRSKARPVVNPANYLMVVTCAWCGKFLRKVLASYPVKDLISHGICRDCAIKLQSEDQESIRQLET